MAEFEITIEQKQTFKQYIEAKDEYEARELADIDDADFSDSDWIIVDIEEL